MAKSFLKDFTIGKDIIDNVEEENFPSVLEPAEKKSEPPAGSQKMDSAVSEESSAEEKASERKAKITVRKEGLFTVFETGGTSYRIGGVKPLFVTSLRVNIRAGNGKVSYYDSIDLYASRGRTGFAQGLYRTWGISPERVEMDLIKILELLEKERDERLLAKSRTQNTELTEEEKAMGLSLLHDRNLFRRITDDMSKMGYVGEELNKILLYLCASSRKLDDPISVLIISQSASGKSYLVDTVRRLMPPEEVVAVTSLSDQALNYIDDLMHMRNNQLDKLVIP